MSKKKQKKEVELSPEDFEKFLVELEEFDSKGFIYLACTDRYEIIPNIDEEGQLISEDNMQYLKSEVEKLGFRVLYKIDKTNGETLLVNPDTMKSMVLVEGMQ